MATLTFDSGTVPDVLTGTTGGVVDRADPTGGTLKALRFLDIDDSETTFFELAVFATADDDTLTIRYEVSSEHNYDYFRLYLDGADILAPEEPGVSGDGDGWQEFTTTLALGAHTLRFEYSKDSSADGGDDTAYLSSITYPAPVGVLGSLTSTASGTFTLTVRYWQVLLQGSTTAQPDTGDGTWLISEIANIEFRGSVGGAAIPTTGGSTFPPYVEDPPGGHVFAPYEISVVGGHAVDKAFDGDPTTTLRSVNNRYCIGYTFASPVHVAEIAITTGSTAYDSYEAFQLQWSEDGYRDSNGSFKNSVTFDDQAVANKWGQVEWGAFETRTISWADQEDIFGQPSVDTGTGGNIALNDAGGLVLQRHAPGSVWVKALIVHNWTNQTGVQARGVIYAVNNDDWPKPGLLLASSATRTSLYGGWTRYEFDPPVFIENQHLLIGVHSDTALQGGASSGVNAENTYKVSATYGTDPIADLTGATTTLLGRQLAAYAVYTLTEPPGATPDEITGTASAALGLLTSSASGTTVSPITGTGAAALGLLASSASGTARRPAFGQRITLMGTKRPTKSLNATWVPK